MCQRLTSLETSGMPSYMKCHHSQMESKAIEMLFEMCVLQGYRLDHGYSQVALISMLSLETPWESIVYQWTGGGGSVFNNFLHVSTRVLVCVLRCVCR